MTQVAADERKKPARAVFGPDAWQTCEKHVIGVHATQQAMVPWRLKWEHAMQLNPYLSFNGQCEAAFKFYERVLGGKIVMLFTYGEAPEPERVSPDLRGKIMHARLMLGDQALMASDAPAGRFEPAKGFHVSLGIDNPTEAERIFRALAANGTVTMPIQETFWAARFGMLVDQFGIPWMINCEKRAA
jgi:PhnB protein